MYPETGDASGGDKLAADYGDYGGGDLKSKIMSNFEGFIPLILIVIIGFFLLARFNILTEDTPLLGPVVNIVQPGTSFKEMLIIGSPSVETVNVLNENRDLVRWRQKAATDLQRNPEQQLAQYDLIMLDQSNQSTKEVSFELGEAIANYVRRGGKLIIVKDSGIYRPNTFDIIGWKSTFQGIIPVDCQVGVAGVHSCAQPINVIGRIVRQDQDHRIMDGIEFAPANERDRYVLETFDVDVVSGNEVAYIETQGRAYPAIVESRSIIGKVIYFNYDPGKSRGIFENTLRYLR
ncbi:MAG TPA: hypothetical protein VJK05_03940 [archaeon]|nr:hypothetical protein [archaeon]